MAEPPSKGLLALALPGPEEAGEVPGESDPDSNPGVDVEDMAVEAASADLVDAVKTGDVQGVARSLRAAFRAMSGPSDME